MPHDEGRKSRCRLVTIITKRSSHMPTLTNMATIHTASGELRTFFIHTTCGTISIRNTCQRVGRKTSSISTQSRGSARMPSWTLSA